MVQVDAWRTTSLKRTQDNRRLCQRRASIELPHPFQMRLRDRKNALVRERQIRRGSTADVQVPRRRKSSQDGEPDIALVSFAEQSANHSPTCATSGKPSKEMYGKGSRKCAAAPSSATHTQDRHGGTGTRRRRWRDNDGRELAINVLLSSGFCEGGCAMLPSYFLAHVL